MALVFDPVGRLMQLVCATPNLNFIDQWMWMLVDGAQRPHPLIYKAQIWGAHSICINLPTGSKIRAVVTPIGAMQPSDNVGMFEIDWLLYLTKPQQLLQIYTYPAAVICKFIATITYTILVQSAEHSPTIQQLSVFGGMIMSLLTACPTVKIPASCWCSVLMQKNSTPELSITPVHKLNIQSSFSTTVI